MTFYQVFFFFKQKTAYEMRISDWSSDVCSSDLHPVLDGDAAAERLHPLDVAFRNRLRMVDDEAGLEGLLLVDPLEDGKEAIDRLVIGRMDAERQLVGRGQFDNLRSEERLVGKECVSS